MKLLKIEDLDFKKENGLIPVVTQDSVSLRVLTLAYVNQEALRRTLETGFAHYYRRSWGKVMKKGIISGNTQKILDIYVDCDSDSLIFLIEQNGVACHLGKQSCFHNRLEGMKRR
jgi:phosphoribosyl-ATP pyrophosphohydrolase/phosphoribosyl-AMP cyclohydrolase